MPISRTALLLPLISATIATQAGNLDSPGTPDDSASAMFSIQRIHDRLATGAPGFKRLDTFWEPSGGPTSGTMATLDEVMSLAPSLKVNGASADQVLSGREYWGLKLGEWGIRTGTMPNIGQQIITPGPTDQTINRGYHDGTGTVTGDPNLVSGNIVHGATLLGLPGTPAPVLHTGQTISYADGDDGDWEPGIQARPKSAGRIRDNGDGTTTDLLTGLTWLKKADCIATDNAGFDTDDTAGDGLVTWQHALDFVKGVNAGTYVCGDTSNGGSHQTDWRLPNRREAESIFNYSQSSPVTHGGLFTDISAGYYWTSTTPEAVSSGSQAWIYRGSDGYQQYTSKIYSNHLMMVRGDTHGSPGALPKTGQATSYALDDDHDLNQGVDWPSPRFTDNGDGTVLDNLTGLVWLKDADCPGAAAHWSDALTFANSLYDGWTGDPSSGDCSLSDGSTSGDWRLPTINELSSLLDTRYISPSLGNSAGDGQWTEGDAFSNVSSTNYWSSTNSVASPGAAWAVSLSIGTISPYSRTASSCKTWPVRSRR